MTTANRHDEGLLLQGVSLPGWFRLHLCCDTQGTEVPRSWLKQGQSQGSTGR